MWDAVVHQNDADGASDIPRRSEYSGLYLGISHPNSSGIMLSHRCHLSPSDPIRHAISSGPPAYPMCLPILSSGASLLFYADITLPPAVETSPQAPEIS